MRRLTEWGDNIDGVMAFLIMMVFILCVAWTPTCIRRYYYHRNETDSVGHRRPSTMDPRIQAEIEMFRRMMEEAALALAPGMPLDARREYILNCLMTKHVIIISGERMISGETKERIPNRKDDVVLDQFHDNESDDDPTTACAICLSEYEDGDEISWSHHPNCSHFFHRSCIAEWLLSHDECPCCRLDFLSFDNDDDDERADDIESGSRESPTAPIRMENADADFARSMQLFFEMVANGRPRTMYSRNNNESRATLTPLQRPFGT